MAADRTFHRKGMLHNSQSRVVYDFVSRSLTDVFLYSYRKPALFCVAWIVLCCHAFLKRRQSLAFLKEEHGIDAAEYNGLISCNNIYSQISASK